MADSKAIAAAGFVQAKRSPRRMIANIQGLPKVGKTSLALSAPKPIGYIGVEVGGEEGVIDKFIPAGSDKSDSIFVAPIIVEPVVYPPRENFAGTKEGEKEYQEAVSEAVQTVAGPALDKFYEAYYYSLKNMATTVVDTGSDLWELARMANFGRLEKVPQLAYTQLNKAMDKLFDDAKSYPNNVLWLHHMKEKWENYEDDRGKRQSRPSGVFDMAGYGGVKKKVQATIELWRQDLEEENPETGLYVDFFGQIIDSRHNTGCMGRKFSTLELTFTDIAMAVFPGTKRSDWE